MASGVRQVEFKFEPRALVLHYEANSIVLRRWGEIGASVPVVLIVDLFARRKSQQREQWANDSRVHNRGFVATASRGGPLKVCHKIDAAKLARLEVSEELLLKYIECGHEGKTCMYRSIDERMRILFGSPPNHAGAGIRPIALLL